MDHLFYFGGSFYIVLIVFNKLMRRAIDIIYHIFKIYNNIQALGHG